MLPALLVAVLLSQAEPHDRRVREYRRAGDRGPGVGLAFFEFAPPSGAGMPSVCGTETVTGAKGETLTFTRSSNGTCTKTATGGLATTGIADGDLVVLSSNVARVEYDSAGVLGLLVESSRTNAWLRSQELDNAAWADEVSGVAVATRTANAATAPDGTLTADRLQFPATTGAQYSTLRQSPGTGAGAASMSIYLRGVSGSGTIDICGYNGVNWTCAACAYVSTSWSRCLNSYMLAAGGAYIGNASGIPGQGGTARSASDVYLWGAQSEAGAYATSYIPTTSAAVTRAAEVAYFLGSFPSGTQCLASSRYGPVAAETEVWALTANRAATGYGLGHYRLAGSFNSLITGTVPVLAYGATLDGTDRVWMSADGTTVQGEFAGTAATTASATTPSAVTALCVGLDCTNSAASGQANGIISRIIYDLTTTRCR